MQLVVGRHAEVALGANQIFILVCSYRVVLASPLRCLCSLLFKLGFPRLHLRIHWFLLTHRQPLSRFLICSAIDIISEEVSLTLNHVSCRNRALIVERGCHRPLHIVVGRERALAVLVEADEPARDSLRLTQSFIHVSLVKAHRRKTELIVCTLYFFGWRNFIDIPEGLLRRLVH